MAAASVMQLAQGDRGGPATEPRGRRCAAAERVAWRLSTMATTVVAIADAAIPFELSLRLWLEFGSVEPSSPTFNLWMRTDGDRSLGAALFAGHRH